MSDLWAKAAIAIESCLACGGRSFRPLPTPGRWIGPEVFSDLGDRIGLTSCRRCGLVLVNPRPTDERLAAFYSGATYSCHEAAGSASAGAKADYLLGRIAKRLPDPVKPRTLLDFGAGGGGFMLHARARGWEVQGFEPGTRGRNNCLAAGLQVADSLDRLPSHHFHLITLHHVFEHLTDPVCVLRQLTRSLAPNGRLFVEVPNAASLRARLALPALSRRFSVDERYRAFPIHLAYYSKRTLARVLARGGWVVNEAFSVGIGLDEFFWDRDPVDAPRSASAGRGAGTSRGRRLRHLARDLFLGLGVGFHQDGTAPIHEHSPGGSPRVTLV